MGGKSDTASHTILPECWTSFVSPAMLGVSLSRIPEDHRFVWDMSGMTQEFADTLARRI